MRLNESGAALTHDAGLGGGTGSGLECVLLECPLSRTTPCCAQIPRSIEHTDITVMMYVEAPHDVCHRNVDVQRLSRTCVSRLLSQIIFSLTASVRFGRRHDADVTEF